MLHEDISNRVSASRQRMNMSIETQNNTQQESKNEIIETNLAKQRQMYERKLEQERIARQQAEERAAALEAATRDRSTRSSSDDDDDQEDSEPYVDRRKLNRELSKFQKNIEQTIEKKAEQKASELLEQERTNNYLRENNDFSQIMENEELVHKFANKHPGLAKSILSMPEGFERQKLVYENI